MRHTSRSTGIRVRTMIVVGVPAAVMAFGQQAAALYAHHGAMSLTVGAVATTAAPIFWKIIGQLRRADRPVERLVA